MTGRERFHATMRFGNPARPPCFDEGLRDGVREVWSTQGLPMGTDLTKRFSFDAREEIEPDLEPRPRLPRQLLTPERFGEWSERLNPTDPARLPAE